MSWQLDRQIGQLDRHVGQLDRHVGQLGKAGLTGGPPKKTFNGKTFGKSTSAGR
jgi:hypothetical protein